MNRERAMSAQRSRTAEARCFPADVAARQGDRTKMPALAKMLKSAGRQMMACLSKPAQLLVVALVALPLIACEREQGNPLPKTPPKPRIESHQSGLASPAR